jgi:hypothetical protein
VFGRSPPALIRSRPMKRCVSAAALVAPICLALLGCREPTSEPPHATPRPQPPPSTDGAHHASRLPADSEPTGAESGAAERPAGLTAGDLQSAALLEHLAGGRISRAVPISKRSLSMRLSLRGGVDAVFKPQRRDDRTARHEVAAYHLSRLLGVGGVPPSTLRRIALDNFAWMLGDPHAEFAAALREQALLDDRSGVWGACIAWVDGLSPSGLDGPSGRAELERLLALDGPSFAQEPLAAQAAELVTFDYVAGNWDRFSGGNLFRDPGGRLVLLDNNGAFSRWSEAQQRRMDDLLSLVQRLPADLFAGLEAFDARDIERALGAEPRHAEQPLLTRGEIELVLTRRDAVVARVRELIAVHGSARVLPRR